MVVYSFLKGAEKLKGAVLRIIQKGHFNRETGVPWTVVDHKWVENNDAQYSLCHSNETSWKTRIIASQLYAWTNQMSCSLHVCPGSYNLCFVDFNKKVECKFTERKKRVKFPVCVHMHGQ